MCIRDSRYTPYHIRHRTEVAGFMTFLHGDDRFYNNIFIQNYPVEETETVEDMGFKMEDNQEVGTHVFDEYPTYDEWISHFELDKPADMSKLEPYLSLIHILHFQQLIDAAVVFQIGLQCFFFGFIHI